MLVVLCYIEYENKILLLKRNNDPYLNYYALPGGKVEEGEKILDAACRETIEETSLKPKASKVLAYASEIIKCDKKESTLFQYDMVLVRIDVDTINVSASEEGELFWCSKNQFLSSSEVVPTDVDMVKRFVLQNSNDFIEYAVIKSDNDKYVISTISKSLLRKVY